MCEVCEREFHIPLVVYMAYVEPPLFIGMCRIPLLIGVWRIPLLTGVCWIPLLIGVYVKSPCWLAYVESQRWFVFEESPCWLVYVKSPCWLVYVESFCWFAYVESHSSYFSAVFVSTCDKSFHDCNIKYKHFRYCPFSNLHLSPDFSSIVEKIVWQQIPFVLSDSVQEETYMRPSLYACKSFVPKSL